jgi:citrate lyase subunit beta/citryl-CoA lyase
MLDKAAGYAAPGYVPDLEDSVPAGEKAKARGMVAGAISSLAKCGVVIPRVNALVTGLAEDDIAAVAVRGVSGISIGKIRNAGEIAEVDRILGERERQQGLAPGSIGILPWIETAEGVARAFDICRASPRVRWVAFGAEDYAADMGIARAVDRSDEADQPYGEPGLFHARAAVAVAARAAGVHALDTPYTRFRDEAGLLREAALAKSLGYKGKLAIHPSQVAPLDRLFAPGEAEIARARSVIDAATAAEADGRGSVGLDGEMIDAPVIARAQNVLRDAGLL